MFESSNLISIFALYNKSGERNGYFAIFGFVFIPFSFIPQRILYVVKS